MIQLIFKAIKYIIIGLVLFVCSSTVHYPAYFMLTNDILSYTSFFYSFACVFKFLLLFSLILYFEKGGRANIIESLIKSFVIELVLFFGIFYAYFRQYFDVVNYANCVKFYNYFMPILELETYDNSEIKVIYFLGTIILVYLFLVILIKIKYDNK